MSTGGCRLPHKHASISIIQTKGLQAAALYFQFSACKADVEDRIFHYICTHSGWCSGEDGKKVSLALQIINRGIRDAQLHIPAVCLSPSQQIDRCGHLPMASCSGATNN